MEIASPHARLLAPLLAAISLSPALSQPRTRPVTPDPPSTQRSAEPSAATSPQAEQHLREAISLTGSSQFQQAIPHFLAARGHVANTFALEFNLALCYVATRQFPDAIRLLTQLSGGQRQADVRNLLAQAYIGAHQADAALKEFQQAANLAPRNERLYMLVSQSCFDEGLLDAGLKVLEFGLRHLPDSGRLHFQRGLFYSQQDEPQLANQEFQLARKLAPNTEIAFIAEAEQALLAGEVQAVIRASRQGIRAGYPHYLLLTLLGEALLRAGATPDAPEFAEVQSVLEQAVTAQPGYSSSHIALGRVYLTLGRIADAIAQIETARRLDPRNKAVYPPLASAYQRSSQPEKAKEALTVLSQLNREDAARTRSADGSHGGYVSGKGKPDK